MLIVGLANIYLMVAIELERYSKMKFLKSQHYLYLNIHDVNIYSMRDICNELRKSKKSFEINKYWNDKFEQLNLKIIIKILKVHEP